MLVDDLEGYLTVESLVCCQVYRGHAAASDLAFNAVAIAYQSANEIRHLPLIASCQYRATDAVCLGSGAKVWQS